MATQNEIRFAEIVRTVPMDCLLVTAVPIAVAAMQLANSYVNGLSVFISVPFTVVMLLFTVLLFQHQVAQFRRQQFGHTFQQPTAD